MIYLLLSNLQIKTDTGILILDSQIGLNCGGVSGLDSLVPNGNE